MRLVKPPKIKRMHVPAKGGGAQIVAVARRRATKPIKTDKRHKKNSVYGLQQDVVGRLATQLFSRIESEADYQEFVRLQKLGKRLKAGARVTPTRRR